MAKKIFIIEDDTNILYGLQSQFSSDGYEVEIDEGGSNIETIISFLEEFRPDYIITDLLLPEIDGFELVRLIKENDRLQDSPIFIFTDLSDEDSRRRSDDLGVDYYFIKNDFDIFEFAEKVKRIISRGVSLNLD
jgi:DNA-binding response OmpR family regulator